MPIPRVRRAFAAWLEANQHRLAIPLQIMPHGRGYGRTSVSFGDIDPRVLNVGFYDTTLRVSAYRPGFPSEWDGLLDIDVIPKRVKNGYICAWCEAEKEPTPAPVFRSREALWADHLFEPLLKFTNETLAHARRLVFYGDDDRGSTAAYLDQGDDEPGEGKPISIFLLKDGHAVHPCNIKYKPLWGRMPLGPITSR